MPGGASASDEEVGKAVMVEVAGYGYAGIDAVVGWRKCIRGKGEMAFAVAKEEPELHLAGIGRVVVAAGSDKEVEVAVVVGVEEENGFVVKVLELIEGRLW